MTETLLIDDRDPREVLREILADLEHLEEASTVPDTRVDFTRERYRRFVALVNQFVAFHEGITGNNDNNLLKNLEILHQRAIEAIQRKFELLRKHMSVTQESLGRASSQLALEERAFSGDPGAREALIVDGVFDILSAGIGLKPAHESKPLFGALHGGPETRRRVNAMLPLLLPTEFSDKVFPAHELVIDHQSINVDAQRGQFRTGDIVQVMNRANERYGRLFHCEGFSQGGDLYLTEIGTSGLMGSPFRFRDHLGELKTSLPWGTYNPADFNFYPNRDRPGVIASFRERPPIQMLDFPRGDSVEIDSELAPFGRRSIDTIANTFGFRGGDLVVARKNESQLTNPRVVDSEPVGIVLGYQAGCEGHDLVCWVTITRKGGSVGHTVYVTSGSQVRFQIDRIAKWGEYDPRDYGFNVGTDFKISRTRYY
jgi:hypothetical protein